MASFLLAILVLVAAPPLMLGLITTTKAWLAGRRGPSPLQPYRELARLFRKKTVFSTTTTWLFRASPVLGVTTVFVAGLMIPLGFQSVAFSFAGDLVLFVYLLGTARFFTAAAALDTGSSFEGMGTVRDLTFACLAEPTVLVILIVLARMSGTMTLSELLTFPSFTVWASNGASMILMSGSLLLVVLAESCRIPFDDPTTHLELTMVHEVMVLDHSGPGFGLIQYGAALKLFVLSSIWVFVVLPVRTETPLAGWMVYAAAMVAMSFLIGLIESSMARLALRKLPTLLVTGLILASFALLLAMR